MFYFQSTCLYHLIKIRSLNCSKILMVAKQRPLCLATIKILDWFMERLHVWHILDLTIVSRLGFTLPHQNSDDVEGLDEELDEETDEDDDPRLKRKTTGHQERTDHNCLTLGQCTNTKQYNIGSKQERLSYSLITIYPLFRWITIKNINEHFGLHQYEMLIFFFSSLDGNWT